MAAEDAPRALRELRRSRRRTHLRTLDIWDALNRVYVTAILASTGVAVASGYVGGDRVAPATAARAVDEGPAVVGLVVAAAVGLAMRAGARGGPLAVEAAEVHVVLLARRLRCRGGQPGQPPAAGRVGGLDGVGRGRGCRRGLATVGAGLVVSGVQVRRAATVAAAALLAWSVGDAVLGASRPAAASCCTTDACSTTAHPARSPQI